MTSPPCEIIRGGVFFLQRNFDIVGNRIELAVGQRQIQRERIWGRRWRRRRRHRRLLKIANGRKGLKLGGSAGSAGSAGSLAAAGGAVVLLVLWTPLPVPKDGLRASASLRFKLSRRRF